MAVLPSPDNATDQPWPANPAAPVPTSLGPCCVNCAGASCGEKRRPAKIRADANTLDERAVMMAPLGCGCTVLGQQWPKFYQFEWVPRFDSSFSDFPTNAIV